MYRAEIDCDMRSFTQRTQKKFMKADLLKEHSHQKIKKKRNNRSLSSADGVGEDSESKNKLSELRSVAAFS